MIDPGNSILGDGETGINPSASAVAALQPPQQNFEYGPLAGLPRGDTGVSFPRVDKAAPLPEEMGGTPLLSRTPSGASAYEVPVVNAADTLSAGGKPLTGMQETGGNSGVLGPAPAQRLGSSAYSSGLEGFDK